MDCPITCLQVIWWGIWLCFLLKIAFSNSLCSRFWFSLKLSFSSFLLFGENNPYL